MVIFLVKSYSVHYQICRDRNQAKILGFFDILVGLGKTLGRFTMKLIFEWDKIVSHGGQFSRFAVRSELIERRGEPCLCAVDIFLHLFPSPQLGRKCDQSVNMTNTFSFFTQLLQLLPVNSF